MLVMTSN